MYCDLCRNLEHSTILYEDPKQLPLLRLSWNKQDPNYLATLALESTEVTMLLLPYSSKYSAPLNTLYQTVFTDLLVCLFCITR